MSATDFRIALNNASDTRRAHAHPALDDVLHVFDVNWHGIRSATACLPGHKLGRSHKRWVDGPGRDLLGAYISRQGLRRVCYQGFSETALDLARWLAREFGSELQQHVVTHVSSSQFENAFEMRMLRAMIDGQKGGLFRRLGSVKPRFSGVVPEFWPQVLVNTAPRIDPRPIVRDTRAVLVPVENTWRKNLYSNMLAALRHEETSTVTVVNWPSALEELADLERVRWVPFMRPERMLATAASVGVVMHASLIECQPMTLLESLAVGTPCISTRLGVHPEIDRHPLTRLTEVEYPDDVGGLAAAVGGVFAAWDRDPGGLRDMIADNLALRRRLCIDSYQSFLG